MNKRSSLSAKRKREAWEAKILPLQSAVGDARQALRRALSEASGDAARDLANLVCYQDAHLKNLKTFLES